ncbi:MAG: methyltransferase domain-containing protein, partial [Actinobacteria bacterium]|nr:methyltransferase domain-containing protein [Actinomycetota bacterium]
MSPKCLECRNRQVTQLTSQAEYTSFTNQRWRASVRPHNHHPSVIRSHSWRSAENSAAYLLPHLASGMDLLDVGCGPGTITVDLAKYVSPGRVVGIDRAETAVNEAVSLGVGNAEFRLGDAYDTGLGDGSFDVIHAHQVLQHLTDPVRALREWKRVLRHGGVLAVRDSDYGAFVWSPADPLLDRWMNLYHQITARNGAEADAGRRLMDWVRTAGFTEVACTSSNWTFADDESRTLWGETWADRVRHSSYAEQALAYDLSTTAELEEIASAFLRWASDPNGVFI